MFWRCCSRFYLDYNILPQLQLTDLVQENALLKGKLVTLNETLANTQLESKASRETIMRLVTEMGREQKVTTRYTAEVENLRLVSWYWEVCWYWQPPSSEWQIADWSIWAHHGVINHCCLMCLWGDCNLSWVTPQNDSHGQNHLCWVITLWCHIFLLREETHTLEYVLDPKSLSKFLA